MIKIWRVLKYVFYSFFEKDCANRAASLAYTTLLSLVPLVVLSFWILSIFPAFSGTALVLQKFILKNFVAHSAEVISEQLAKFLDQTRVLSLTNLGALVVVSILMIYDMVGAFNGIWHVKMQRHFFWSLSFYSLLLLLAPVFFGVFMMASSYLASFPFIADISHMEFLEKPILYALPYLAAFLIFTLLNWVLPSCRVPFRNAALAGVITMILFEIVKFLFSIYIIYISNFRILYGALSAFPIFLLWIYTSWVIVLLGALICQVITRGIPERIFLDKPSAP